MPRPRKLTRRDGTYYCRIHTPADVLPAMGGRKEFWRSLKTKDYPEALKREPLDGSPTFVLNDGRQKLFGNVAFRIIEANIREMLQAPNETQASWC